MNKRHIIKEQNSDKVNEKVEKIVPIILQKPKAVKDKTVFNAIKQRKTIREISDKKLPLQTLSNLLWAACGVNRKKGPFGIGGRTAATASNSQEIYLYVALKEGIYLYDAFLHKLIPVIAGDFRRHAIGKGQLSLGDKAPVRLIYVADIDKLANTKGFQEPGLQNPEVQKSYYFVDTGIIAGNIYLFAASQGLASWFHNCNKQELSALLKLRKDQRVIFGHTIGYPQKKK
ncbi:MAG: nitroreductase family protein [Bacteroidales bacterium]|jgi:SagB-type dehydrogenase family enzyme